MLRKSICGLVLLYGLATVLLPVFVLNKLVFIPLFILSVCAVLCRPVKIFAPILVFAIFLYGFLLGGVNGADPELARQKLLASTSLFLIYVIYAFKVDMEIYRQDDRGVVCSCDVRVFIGAHACARLRVQQGITRFLCR